jgi:hypothetical protein
MKMLYGKVVARYLLPAFAPSFYANDVSAVIFPWDPI